MWCVAVSLTRNVERLEGEVRQLAQDWRKRELGPSKVWAKIMNGDSGQGIGDPKSKSKANAKLQLSLIHI